MKRKKWMRTGMGERSRTGRSPDSEALMRMQTRRSNRARRVIELCATAAALTLMVVIASCSSQTSDLTRADAVGAWRADADRVQLTLRADGRFEAVDWLLDAGCSVSAEGDVTRRGDFEGRWEKEGTRSAPRISLYPESGDCAGSVLSGNLWRIDGVEYVCVLRATRRAPGADRSDDFYQLYRGGGVAPDPLACTLYD
jgi:hypothetical protein